jgi:outer membrane protein OmpA-like peptidoglycan-associated protein
VRNTLRLLLVTAHTTILCAAVSAQVQTAPVTEPRGQEEAAPVVAKGSAAITRHSDKCSTRLVVDADALFKPHRWTLNANASQTLDALGPMLPLVYQQPPSVSTYTAGSDSETENRDVGQRRAMTVRTWLVNHKFLPEATTAQASDDVSPKQKNGVVAIVFKTCP